MKKCLKSTLKYDHTLFKCILIKHTSTDEVEYNKMKNYMGQNEISETTFRRNSSELLFIFWVDL